MDSFTGVFQDTFEELLIGGSLGELVVDVGFEAFREGAVGGEVTTDIATKPHDEMAGEFFAVLTILFAGEFLGKILKSGIEQVDQ